MLRYNTDFFLSLTLFKRIPTTPSNTKLPKASNTKCNHTSSCDLYKQIKNLTSERFLHFASLFQFQNITTFQIVAIKKEKRMKERLE